MTSVTVNYLVNHAVGLGEEHNVVGLENVVYEVVEYHDEQVFIFIVLNCIPYIKNLFLSGTQIILALNLHTSIYIRTYLLLYHKIRKRLLLNRVHKQEQELVDFGA